MKDFSNDVVLQRSKNGVPYLVFRKLLEYEDVKHCYTMKEGNIDIKVYKDDTILKKSYDKICEVVGFDRKHIVKPHQTHTDNVEKVEHGSENFSEVDGVMTNKAHITLCTTSADCTAILLYDPMKKVIGNVHSGWKGTLQRIGGKAVQKMIVEYGCCPKDIIACICPHIRKCHFEVERDVMQLFENEFVEMHGIQEIITKGKIVEGVQKYFIDTTKINKNILKELGILEENIFDSGICTVCEKKYFHSHRGEKGKAGRNGAMIMLE